MVFDADPNTSEGRKRPLLERGLDEVINPENPNSPTVAQAWALACVSLGRAVPEEVAGAVEGTAVRHQENVMESLKIWNSCVRAGLGEVSRDTYIRL